MVKSAFIRGLFSRIFFRAALRTSSPATCASSISAKAFEAEAASLFLSFAAACSFNPPREDAARPFGSPW